METTINWCERKESISTNKPSLSSPDPVVRSGAPSTGPWWWTRSRTGPAPFPSPMLARISIFFRIQSLATAPKAAQGHYRCFILSYLMLQRYGFEPLRGVGSLHPLCVLPCMVNRLIAEVLRRVEQWDVSHVERTLHLLPTIFKDRIL